MPKPKGATSYRFSSEAQELLSTLADALGLSKTAVLEMSLRKLARSELPPGKIPPESKPVRLGRPPKAAHSTAQAPELKGLAKNTRGARKK
jgi:hypothetical protein